MNCAERIGAVEGKLKYIEKLLYIIIVGMGGHVGIEFIPVITAYLP